MTTMTLSLADQLVDATLRHARDKAVAPLAVAVLDAGGHIVVVKREDRATLLRVDLAVGKARGALGMGFGTRALAQMAQAAPHFFTGAMAATGTILPSPGGILLRDDTGETIGAIGVSGDNGDVDEACAIPAIEALGLQTSL